MTKKIILAVAVGWALSLLLSPRDVLGWAGVGKPRTA
jgi:hypothetical protein